MIQYQQEEMLPTNFTNSEGAAKLLTQLLGRDNWVSHDSMRQYALRGRIAAWFFKNGELVKYMPGMSAQGAASGFIFFIEDIYELAKSSKVGVGREGYPQWKKDEVLNVWLEEQYQFTLYKDRPLDERHVKMKPPSFRDIERRTGVSWMTVRNWVREYQQQIDKQASENSEAEFA